MGRTLAYDIIHPNTAVLVHGRENPADDEWGPYIEALRDLVTRVGEITVLVVTDGGGPNSVQRAELNERVLAGRTMLGAVVTESRIARGIVTALSWFNSGIKAYPPVRLREALRYLGLEEEAQAEALFMVSRLRGELGLTPFEGMPVF